MSRAQVYEFAPPPPTGTARSVGASLFIHGLLVVALTWGIRWKSDTLQYEAELWAAVPVAAAPKLVETPDTPAPPPPPAPAVKPPPAPPTPSPDADIALAKKRKAEEEAAKQLALERQRQEAVKKEVEEKARLKQEAEKRQRELDKKAKLEKEKKEREKLEREKAEREKERKLAEQKKDKELKEKKAAEETQKLETLRQENMKRMQGMAGATGGENATGTAKQSAGPSDSYGGRVRARVKPNIVFTEEITNNNAAEVEVRLAPTGLIVGTKLLKSSGNKAWDDAVLKALDKTEELPRDVDGRIHTPLIITFRPRD